MNAALQIYYTAFDTVFFKLPADVRDRIEAKIDDMGRRLDKFPHHRLTGNERYRLRVGDYRVIYTFNIKEGVIQLLAVGNRREIYRKL